MPKNCWAGPVGPDETVDKSYLFLEQVFLFAHRPTGPQNPLTHQPTGQPVHRPSGPPSRQPTRPPAHGPTGPPTHQPIRPPAHPAHRPTSPRAQRPTNPVGPECCDNIIKIVSMMKKVVDTKAFEKSRAYVRLDKRELHALSHRR